MYAIGPQFSTENLSEHLMRLHNTKCDLITPPKDARCS